MKRLLDSVIPPTPAELQLKLAVCLQLRQNDPALSNSNSYRLFNGFYEGFTSLTVDLFANTVLLTDHNRDANPNREWYDSIARFYMELLPNVRGVVLKRRHSRDSSLRNGQLLLGEGISTSITENGVNYALDLQLNQDSSFYPDTRNLRLWLTAHMIGARVLNCFAYTGALGISALAGGAKEVLQTDLNRQFLAVSERSAAINAFLGEMKLLAQDFYPTVAHLKSQSRLFDCVILDAPLFSQTRRGKVDLMQNWKGLVNKVRPLIGHEGWLVAINNALFLSGSVLMETVHQLTGDGYLKVEEIISVPADVTGYAQTAITPAPADPAPFNHPTKIIIMRAYRKDSRRA